MSIAVRIVAAILLSNIGIQTTWEFDTIARNLAAGLGFTTTGWGIKYFSLVVPLYTVLNALVYKISGNNYYAMLFVQIILSSLIAVVIFKIAQIFYDKKVALLAAILVIFHPGLVLFSSATLHALTLYALMFSIVVLFFVRARNSPTWRNLFLLGLSCGLSILTRPSVIIFIFFASLWLFSLLKTSLLKKIKFLASIYFIMLTVVSPWLIRNYIIHKQLVLQTSMGYVFYVGNNEKAIGPATFPDGKTVQSVMPPDFMRKIYSMDSEIKQNNAFFQEGLKFIRKYPHLFIKLFFKKLFYFWWFSPSAGVNYPALWAVVYKIYYSLIFILFLIGVYSALAKGKYIVKDGMLLLLILFISISVSQSLYYVDGRHRWEIEPLFMIPVSAALFKLAQIKKGKLN